MTDLVVFLTAFTIFLLGAWFGSYLSRDSLEDRLRESIWRNLSGQVQKERSRYFRLLRSMRNNDRA